MSKKNNYNEPQPISILDTLNFLIEDGLTEEESTVDVNEWVFLDGLYHPSLNSKRYDKLPPGFYTVGYDQGKYFAIPNDLELDEIYKLPNDKCDRVFKEITDFWTKADLYKEHNFVHKRGILLVGPPGNGKTSMINLINKQVIDNGGVVFHISNVDELRMTVTLVNDYLREFQPNTPIVTVIEDIDNIVDRDEHFLLSMLDGENQMAHNVVVATSNRLHELNDLLLRPSRFDWVVEIDSPDEEVRRFYFKKKGINEDLLDSFTRETEGMSMAHLKEVFISTQLLGYTLEDTVAKLTDVENSIEIYAGKKKRVTVGY